MPDIFMEGTHSERWIEMKYLKELPKRMTTVVDLCNPKFLSVLQQLWLDRRTARHHDALVILGHPDGCVVFDNNSWKTPLTCEELLARTIPLKIAAQRLSVAVNTSADNYEHHHIAN